MEISFDGEATADQALSETATRARELAQQRIVMAFRSYLVGCGPGPTDSELQIFAKLAVVEHALKGDYLSLMARTSPLQSQPVAAPPV